MIEWDTLVLEARRKSREVNPRACILTDADIVLAMADEIDRLHAVVADYRRQHDRLLWEQDRPCACEICRRILAAAEASAAPPPVPAPADPPDPPPTGDRSAPRTHARPPRA